MSSGAKEMKRWQKQLSKSAIKKIIKKGAKNSVKALEKLVKDGFEKEKDPYGKKWQPKKIKDGNKTLTGKTKRLKKSWRLVPSEKLLEWQSSVEYAEFHQKGTRYLVIRRQVPDKGLPKEYQDALNNAFDDAFKDNFK